jgi:hypothetical protein
MTIEFQPPYSAQGDLNIFSCEEIPEGLIEKPPENGKHVLAHSETGHNHVIDENTARVYEENEFVSYLDVEEESNVVHLRSFDTHETIKLPAGRYKITRQREYTPEGFTSALI